MITPLLFILISLTFLLLLPGNDVEGSSWWETYKIDKLVHIISFAILALSTSITLSKLCVLIDTNYRLMILILVVCGIITLMIAQADIPLILNLNVYRVSI